MTAGGVDHVGAALLVVSDPSGWARPEPGVRRLPTVDEQHRALARWAVRLGVSPFDVPLVLGADDRLAAADQVARAASAPDVGAVLCISTECVTGPAGVDLPAVLRIWSHVDLLGFMVEDLLVTDAAACDRLVDTLRSFQLVRERDADPAWSDLVRTYPSGRAS